MVRFNSNENLPFQVVLELRALGHDVLTSFEAGRANAAMPDADVLAFAAAEGRILLTNNRRHSIALHNERSVDHAGIAVCTYDPDLAAQARRIHDAVAGEPAMKGKLVRVNRPG